MLSLFCLLLPCNTSYKKLSGSGKPLEIIRRKEGWTALTYLEADIALLSINDVFIFLSYKF